MGGDELLLWFVFFAVVVGLVKIVLRLLVPMLCLAFGVVIILTVIGALTK